ncbi:radical SAM protein [Candidatus Sumerlaeota bacterium]|nr:radical SAM protein [Candidatus Sumerlaeota bacterium]
MTSLVFGPVPSRRLGHSLGINNIPPKICTYSCVYCQVGRTMNMQIDRQPFYKPHDILKAVQKRIEAKRAEGEPVDYVTFVPDGEPTLDINLKTEIALLKQLGTPIAVISNGSLIWNEKVRDDLMEADWVSLKIDAVDEAVWRRVNRPHKRLNLSAVLEGALTFSRSFEGTLATETMLAADVNDGEQNLRQVAEFLARLRPSVAYLSIPTRPPAEQWVYAPDENVVNRAYQILKTRVEHLEYLTGYEGEAFASTGNIQEDVLSITAVHPMREEAIGTLLQRVGSDWAVIDQMVAANQITPAQYEGHKYYVRRFKKKTG